MELIDLTHLLNSDISVYPGTEKPIFESICTLEKDGFAEMRMSLYTHVGTHIDAPAHMIKGGKTLDKFIPDNFFGKAICIDCTDMDVYGKIINKKYIECYAESIKQVDFVIIWTAWAEKWKSEKYFDNYPTLSNDACEWLVSHKLKGIGIDAISMDVLSSRKMENHLLILDKEMLIIENLTNLHLLGNEIFTFVALPLKIENADGSPVRAIAIR